MDINNSRINADQQLLNRTPRRILIGLNERDENGVYQRSKASVIYSHTGQDFIVFGESSQQNVLDELRYYVSQLLPSQTVVPGKIGMNPQVERGEKTLRLFVELENSLS